ncbi:amylopullulanase Apu [Gottschalkia purinilytica]|uniref:Amylopullulanase Apu n=1 Tax=Gottschalkia purinilytica TaxID=1503 RepID=A0A0L0W8Z3_GOTPU|nr:glycoside hydrolase family 13 protein [Gottschalkia purinilytica]KNF07927.1 amylopullulanase Apu [Gottschalkia purinilytica]
MNWIFHDSHNLYYRNPFGALECDSIVTLRIKITCSDNIEEVKVRLCNENVEGKSNEEVHMNLIHDEDNIKIFEIKVKMINKIHLLWYYFIVKINGKIYYYGNNIQGLGGVGHIYDHTPLSYQITVHKKNNNTPNWFKHSIIYQIFVDRFYNGNEKDIVLKPKRDMIIRSNWSDTPSYIKDDKGRVIYFDYFGGNLLGIIKKLSYLKELGINLIYLNPIFEAASNHKYDTGDYKKIDSMFGDEDIFRKLCDEAKKLGMSIILDGVFSHTGSDSIYFNKEKKYDTIGAYQSKDSKYYSWYKFKEYPYNYECWWGVETLPNVNELDESFQDFIINSKDSILKKWMSIGIHGWRLDVADELPKEFIQNFKKEMKNIKDDSILIGEVWEDASNKISYGELREYLLGYELDSVMNYPFRKIILDFMLGEINALDVHKNFMKLYESYPLHHFYSMMNLIGSHDVPRILTLLGDSPEEHSLSEKEKREIRLSDDKKRLALSRLKLLTIIQMTFPGVPSIYYGDEVGVEGYSDPLNRRTYPWEHENKEILKWYKKLAHIRNKYSIMRTGRWISIYPEENVYGYIRMIENSKDVFGEDSQDNLAVILINRSENSDIDLTINVNELVGWNVEKLHDLIEEETVDLKDGTLHLKLNKLQGVILMKNV